MPKLPSLSHLWNSILAVIKRFLVELLFALTGTVAGTVLVEVQNRHLSAEMWCGRMIMAANLGLLLSLSATLLCESRQFSPAEKALFRCVAIAFALGLLFIINPAKQQADYVRFLLFSLAFHLLVSFAAFNRKTGLNGFWQFNKTLFLRFLSGALYAAVLFAGLSAAIGSMNFLFGFDFEWDTFVILWIWITGLFLTVFFLAGVPADLGALENNTSYPKGLKVFAQYVLIPLATVYVLILLAYELKILIRWDLPKGLVSNLILGYAVFGILSLLLVFPIRNEDENRWIKAYSRSFYLLMLPLIALLVVAVVARVSSYGVTVPRYFLLVLAAWLTFITLYFLVSKKQNIRIIPISLALLTLLTVYGPQGAFFVSEYSQVNRLKNLFKRYGAFDGRYLKPLAPVKIPSSGQEELLDLSYYVVREYGLESLQRLMKPDLKRITDSLAKVTKNRLGYRVGYEQAWFNQYLHIDRLNPYASRTNFINRRMITNSSIPVEGYRYIEPVNTMDTLRMFNAGKKKLGMVRLRGGNMIRLMADGKVTDFDLSPLLDSLEKMVGSQRTETVKSIDLNPAQMKISDPKGQSLYSIYFNMIDYNIENKKKRLQSATGYLLIK